MREREGTEVADGVTATQRQESEPDPFPLASGYRLVCEVNDKVVVVPVIAVGKRDKCWFTEQQTRG